MTRSDGVVCGIPVSIKVYNCVFYAAALVKVLVVASYCLCWAGDVFLRRCPISGEPLVREVKGRDGPPVRFGRANQGFPVVLKGYAAQGTFVAPPPEFTSVILFPHVGDVNGHAVNVLMARRRRGSRAGGVGQVRQGNETARCGAEIHRRVGKAFVGVEERINSLRGLGHVL